MRFRTAAAFAPLAILVFTAQLSPGISGEQQPPVDCANANSTYEINFCEGKEFDKADAVLNETYAKVLKQVASSDGEKPHDPKSWEEAMRISQRAWVAFRDADCKGLIPMEWGGGTGTTAAILACMIELTTARAKDLDERYNKN